MYVSLAADLNMTSDGGDREFVLMICAARLIVILRMEEEEIQMISIGHPRVALEHCGELMKFLPAIDL